MVEPPPKRENDRGDFDRKSEERTTPPPPVETPQPQEREKKD
ncbi:MAG: hypothetical protein AAF483_06515 [Planctomycetota bacterium]